MKSDAMMRTTRVLLFSENVLVGCGAEPSIEREADMIGLGGSESR